jgi:hypothetical protein
VGGGVTEWHEKAYLGGPPPDGLPALPRPLYPPDASSKGKQPSSDGPDVVAFKRALCRAGRWGSWDPSSWDDSYSNLFAHGRGPNVKDTGLAGFQRQMDIDDTGWLGSKTYSAMSYALISDPDAAHYREPIFDGECVRLLNSAWERFGGNEPPPPQTGTLRQRALQKAITQIGVKESPPDSNQVKYTDWYGMIGPWCAMFCTWCFETEGDSPAFVRGQSYAYVPYIVADARAGRHGLKTTDDPIPGDLVCYDWAWDGEYDHVGIFEKWVPGSGEFQALEGNTSTSNDSNGGQVMRRTRNRSEQSTVFVRVAE